MILSCGAISSRTSSRTRLIVLLLAASLAVPTGAQQPTVQPASRPKVALVFEGGGALGFAHIGVIEWIEAHHIPVDYVAGTSMGGLVGGLYASGMSPQEIATFVGISCGLIPEAYSPPTSPPMLVPAT